VLLAALLPFSKEKYPLGGNDGNETETGAPAHVSPLPVRSCESPFGHPSFLGLLRFSRGPLFGGNWFWAIA